MMDHGNMLRMCRDDHANIPTCSHYKSEINSTYPGGKGGDRERQGKRSSEYRLGICFHLIDPSVGNRWNFEITNGWQDVRFRKWIDVKKIVRVYEYGQGHGKRPIAQSDHTCAWFELGKAQETCYFWAITTTFQSNWWATDGALRTNASHH